MTMFNCFPAIVGRKKKVKDAIVSSPISENRIGLKTMQVKLEHPVKVSEVSEHDEPKSTLFSVPVPFGVPEISGCNVKVMNPNESPIEEEPEEEAYEGEDEKDDKLPMSRDNSDSNLQACDVDSGNTCFEFGSPSCADVEARTHEIELGQGGHVSDPGMAREERWASPKLTRSCSTLDTREVLTKIADQLPPSKTQSFEQLQELADKVRDDILMRSPCSQSSELSYRSADKVMLKKHSSSQILPSRSKKLWWKLFLWSHRNLQKPLIPAKTIALLASVNQQGGYSSDTLEPYQAKQLSKVNSVGSFSEQCSYKSSHEEEDNGFNLQKALIPAKTIALLASVNQQGGYSSDTLEPYRAKQLSKVNSVGSFSEQCSYKSSHEEEDNGFKDGISGLWPQNQWIAFSGESSSPFKRIDDWVKDIEVQPTTSIFEVENDGDEIVYPSSPEANDSISKNATLSSRQNKSNLSEELLHANSVIQSLNSSSTVAHISGMGLKAIPMISHFSTLRSINLSNNSIVQVTQGSLPKGLHVLDLSRNKITTIEGLRELTRLRVLDLSYNRISHIRQGLSGCSLLKELYLAGNKISEVEGLHRLLRLMVLDLSFNKITTSKALGQLVANYNSLLGLNIVGNPIHSNLSNDQLRRAVCGLLPKLAYLNKQPVNQQKAREVSMDIVAKTSSRNSNWNARRKSVKKSSHSGAMLSGSARSTATIGQRNKNKSKRQVNQQSRLRV